MVAGRFRDSRHAAERKAERDVDLFDIQKVIRTGWYEPSEDRFKEEHKSWTYAIRGKTVDGVDITVVVAFDEEDFVVVVTARPP